MTRAEVIGPECEGFWHLRAFLYGVCYQVVVMNSYHFFPSELDLVRCVCDSLLPPVADGESTSNIFASGCTKEEVKLQCPAKHHIAVKRVFFGVKYKYDCVPQTVGTYGSGWQGSRLPGNSSSDSYSSNDNCCRATPKDCQVDDNHNLIIAINTRCSGKGSCDLLVKRKQTEEPCRHKAYTDYMTIVYDCVFVADVAHFCSDTQKQGKSVYLSNAEYPGALVAPSGGEKCECGFFTTHPKGISIHAIDVLLAWSEKGSRDCRRLLDIQDPLNYERRLGCRVSGFYGFESLYSRAVPNVTVTLESLSGTGMAYVWLQAKPNDADGVVEILCGKPLQDLKDRLIREAQEARDREKAKEEKEKGGNTEEGEEKGEGSESEEGTGEDDEKGNGTATAIHTYTHTGHSDIMTIVWGIVAAGFILIAIVIIAMALHCKRNIQEKKAKEQKPLSLYPAMESEPLDLSSYCRYTNEDGEEITDGTSSNGVPFVTEQHVCSINRSPVKMSSYIQDGHGTITSNGGIHHGNGSPHRPNGFATIVTPADFQIHRDPTPSPPLPAGISTPPPSASHLAGKSYRGVQYPGDLSLRFVKPLQKNGGPPNGNNLNTFGNQKYGEEQDGHFNNRQGNDSNIFNASNQSPYHQGHTTLPANRKPVLIPTGPKSPLGKRSKSVTFSQPVAMVTPLNSESDESVSGRGLVRKDSSGDNDSDPSYDNLHKLDIDIESFLPPPPPPLTESDGSLPSPPPTPPRHLQETDMIISIPRYDKGKHDFYREESPNRPLSTFSNTPSPRDELKFIVKDTPPPVLAPPPPLPPSELRMLVASDSDDTAYMSDSSSTFWSPTRQSGKPLVLPKPQKAELFETGV
ncbi:hypothetical protein PoB_000202100 [Plakobranchus ocellatus]|uniref:SUEL-type lectin domain-containing protein n=1 Tax=Plakobranchus ocellatus TaxID=259542 RepID=A0AAV3X7A3_9GAST|nr:hypothetical protein PoB_000202100 [Plakobranchus ocellatus]